MNQKQISVKSSGIIGILFFFFFYLQLNPFYQFTNPDAFLSMRMMNNSISSKSSRSMLYGTVTKREGRKKNRWSTSKLRFSAFLLLSYSHACIHVFFSRFFPLLVLFLLLLLLFASMLNALLPARLQDKRLKLSSTKRTFYRRYKYTYKQTTTTQNHSIRILNKSTTMTHV